jgi:hypothetical protein
MAQGTPQGAAKEPTTQLFEGLLAAIRQRVQSTGAIKAEALWTHNFAEVTESKVRLNKVESRTVIRAHEWVKGTIKLEFRGSSDKVTVRRAFITVGDTEKFPLYLRAGRNILPMGFEDYLSITDPLTKEVFEADAMDHVALGIETGAEELEVLEAGSIYGEVYLYNGPTNKGGGAQHIEEHYGASVGYRLEKGDLFFNTRVDFISSVFDSENLSGSPFFFPDPLLDTNVQNYARGIGVYALVVWGEFSLVAEYLTALNSARFTLNNVAVGVRPRAWALEGAYTTTKLVGKKTYVALGYSRTEGLAGAFPQSRLLANAGLWVFDRVLLVSLEYAREEDYGTAAGGTGGSSDALTSRLTFRW